MFSFPIHQNTSDHRFILFLVPVSNTFLPDLYDSIEQWIPNNHLFYKTNKKSSIISFFILLMQRKNVISMVLERFFYFPYKSIDIHTIVNMFHQFFNIFLIQMVKGKCFFYFLFSLIQSIITIQIKKQMIISFFKQIFSCFYSNQFLLTNQQKFL